MKRLQVLLAEDNSGDMYLVREALRVHHVECDLYVVEDGVQAHRYLARLGISPEAPCPDVFLLDLNITRGDGHQILKEFRAHPLCSAVPVIIVTSSDASTDRTRAEQLGATAFFRKPSDLKAFMELGSIVIRLTASAAARPSN